MVDGARLTAFSRDYLDTWERRANVRRRARYLIPADAGDAVFPTLPHPLLNTPEVVALPAEAQRFLRAQMVYFFKNQIALLETEAGGPLAAALANRHRQIELPRAARQAALTVDVDERYHALMERDYLEQAEAITAIRPSRLGDRSLAGEAIGRAGEMIHPEFRVDLEAVLICLIENAITAELFGLQTGSPPTGPFYIAAAEHLADEGRHSAFFRLLLAYYWPRLEEEERAAVGQVMPVFLDCYLGPNPQAIAAASLWLREVGLGADLAHRLAVESNRRRPRHENPLWRNIRGVMARTGLLDHAPTRSVLAAGWV
jgi:hypothetical protein